MAWKRSSVRIRYSPRKGVPKRTPFVLWSIPYIFFIHQNVINIMSVTQRQLKRECMNTIMAKEEHFQVLVLPGKLFYSEKYASRSEAMNREKEIKSKKSRKYIESLLTKSVL